MKSNNLNLKDLRESMGQITEYWAKSGKYYPRSRRVLRDLHHPDPFVVYCAAKAAHLILEDQMLYN